MPNLSAVPPPASVRTLTAGEQLSQVDSGAWDELVAAAPRPSPYLLSTWVRAPGSPSRASSASPSSSWPSAPAGLVGVAPFDRAATRARAHRELRRLARVGARGHPAGARRGRPRSVASCSTPSSPPPGPTRSTSSGCPPQAISRAPPGRAHDARRARRGAGHRDAGGLGGGLHPPRQLEAPQHRPAARAAAERARQSRVLARHRRREAC